MKKEELFLRHRYGKAKRMAVDTANPITSEQAEDRPKQSDWPTI
jgi:hypothetical protein